MKSSGGLASQTLTYLFFRRRFCAASFVEAHDSNEEGAAEGTPIYIDQLCSLPEYGKTTLFVDFSHILIKDVTVAEAISNQYYR